MLDVIEVEEALKKVKKEIPYRKKKKVRLWEAQGLYCAQDINSKENIPSYHRSLVDGYCVKSKNVFGCSSSIPAMLTYQGEISMGELSEESLQEDHCMYVPTGGEIIAGSDAVVMIEYVEDMGDEFRYIQKPVAPGDGIVFIGDDIQEGQKIVRCGDLLSAKKIGALAALGVFEVEVFEPLTVGIVATGDELVDIAEEVIPGQIRDINNPLLATLLQEHHCMFQNYGIVKDEQDEIQKVLAMAIQACDVVLVSGGSSVGEKDQTIHILEQFPKAKTQFHGLALKPGKPTMGVLVDECQVFGLPGHPLAAYFVFQVLLAPYIRFRYGNEEAVPYLYARASVRVASNHGREECINVHLVEQDGVFYFEPIYSKSGMISRLLKSDGYIRVPRDQEGVDEGVLCKVYGALYS